MQCHEVTQQMVLLKIESFVCKYHVTVLFLMCWTHVCHTTIRCYRYRYGPSTLSSNVSSLRGGARKMLGVLVTVVIAGVVGYVVFVLCCDTRKDGGNALEDFLDKNDGRLRIKYTRTMLCCRFISIYIL